MENNYIDNSNLELQTIRNDIICKIANQKMQNDYIKMNADALYNLGLTMYSGDESFKSSIYNAVYKSKLDDSFSLHPEQVKIIKCLEKEKALIVSAPTSFGKTFCVFEYIFTHKPKIVVMVVPTLSLVDEYMRRVLKKYKAQFSDYKIYINVDKDKEYDLNQKSIFILTHDKTINEDVLSVLNHIDFLVIDEVYKLENNSNDDRVIVLNVAYYELSKRSEKYILLAPFIEDVNNRERLVNYPVFYKTDYSPVFNKLIERNITIDSEKIRFEECSNILNEIGCESKTLVYFPRVSDLNHYVEKVICNLPKRIIEDEYAKNFIKWASKEIHQEWAVVKAMERGFLIHNGQITRGTKSISLFLFESSNDFNRLLCTSSLLEGVNTVTENIIITKPYNNDKEFSAFDFYNLIGRSGRLNKYFVGNAYYIKSPEDKIYKKEMASHRIEFELTTGNDDMDIAIGNFDNKEFNDFIKNLGITFEDYKTNIGFRNRFSTVKSLYDTFVSNLSKLEEELIVLDSNERRSSYYLVDLLIKTMNGNENSFDNKSLIVNYLLDLKRPSIKTVIENIFNFRKNVSVKNKTLLL